MSELFVHELLGHRKGIEWKITDGVERYEFTTNWINEFPYLIEEYSVDSAEHWTRHLQRILDEQGVEYKLNHNTINPRGGQGNITVEIEREAFESIREELKDIKIDPKDEDSPSEFEFFEHNFSAQARWTIPRYQKVKLSNEMQELLKEQRALNEDIETFRQAIQSDYTLVEDSIWLAEETYDREGAKGVLELYDKQFNPKGRKPVPKFYREHGRKRLEELVEAEPEQNYFQEYEHRNDIVGIMAKTAQLTEEHQSFLEARTALQKPEKYANEDLKDTLDDIILQRGFLEERLHSRGHNLIFKDDKLKYLSHFDIVKRETGRIKLDEITLLKDAQGKASMMSAEDFLSLPKAYYDIEKPQFDTWMEVISWCATLIDYDNKIERVLDTDKQLPWEEIEGYKVRRHRYEHELNKAISSMVEDSYLHFIFNVVYEASQMRGEGSFKVEHSQPRKKATVDTDVDAKRDFMARWEMNKFGEEIDWMRYSRIAKPHRPTHRLESYMNHQRERAGKEKAFEKIVDYVQMRVADQWSRYIGQSDLSEKQKKKAEELGHLLARYTVSDVEIMYENMQLQPTIDDFHDVVDIAQTFGVSIKQVMNNANTVRELHDRRFFELQGHFNDEGFFREIHRAEIQNFKSNYTAIKKKTFSESGLELEFEKGMLKGVDQYYFSPELTISRLLANNYPEILDFANRTLELEDAERQVGRFQYLRSFAIPVLSDHNNLRKRRKRLGEIVSEIEDKAHRTAEIQREWGKYVMTTDFSEAEEKNVDAINYYLSQEKVSKIEKMYLEPELQPVLEKFFKRTKIQKDEELLAVIQPLKHHFAQEQGVKTPFKELSYLISKFLHNYEDINQENTTGLKTRLKELQSWRNRVSFFQRMYGTDLETLEQGIFDAFEEATHIVQDAQVEVKHVEGKFLYVKGALDPELAKDAGLVKIQEDLTALCSSGGNLTYNNDGYYKGKRNSRPIATHTRGLFLQQTEYGILDRLFDEDIKGALEVVAQGAQRTLNLSYNDASDLLTHTRSRGVYKGWVRGVDEIVEFTELDKNKFRPDLGLYIREYMEKFFGEGVRTAKSGSHFSSLIDAVIPFDFPGKFMGFGIETEQTKDLYQWLITGESGYEQEEIIDELVKEYRLR